MLKKRIIAGITVKDNIVVQSIGYKKYLPLGKVEYFIKNLNNWGVDEILIRDIDAYKLNKSPNFEVIKKIKNIYCNTPIIYGGGISNFNLAKEVLKHGVDRILLESIFFENSYQFKKIVENVGVQSIILSLSIKHNQLINYHDFTKININSKKFIFDNASEILINDVDSDGIQGKFNEKNINFLKKIKPKLILHGGLSNLSSIKKFLKNNKINALCISNFFNFKEHQYQNIKKSINSNLIREEKYE